MIPPEPDPPEPPEPTYEHRVLISVANAMSQSYYFGVGIRDTTYPYTYRHQFVTSEKIQGENTPWILDLNDVDNPDVFTGTPFKIEVKWSADSVSYAAMNSIAWSDNTSDQNMSYDQSWTGVYRGNKLSNTYTIGDLS